jgi:hypothetical protein
MFSKIATLAVGISRSFGRVLGNQIAVIVTPHRIKLRMIDPDSTDRYWDESFFTAGNIYFEGFANPIKPRVPESESEAREERELELITSDRYKEMMEQSLITDIIGEGTKDSGLTLLHVLVIVTTVQLCMTGLLAYLIIY